jgi:serine/threonine-protein kinase
VDVSIAVAPSPQVVANVTNIGQDAAVQVLRGQVFLPVVLTQYSGSIPVGLVVSQLPKGGDTANSGTNVFVVVSLGPGTRGSVMPSLIGKPIEKATSLLATETLFPFTRTASATGVAGGIVVDQTPAPGSTLMVGSNVALAVTPR